MQEEINIEDVLSSFANDFRAAVAEQVIELKKRIPEKMINEVLADCARPLLGNGLDRALTNSTIHKPEHHQNTMAAIANLPKDPKSAGDFISILFSGLETKSDNENIIILDIRDVIENILFGNVGFLYGLANELEGQNLTASVFGALDLESSQNDSNEEKNGSDEEEEWIDDTATTQVQVADLPGGVALAGVVEPGVVE